jgi:hypothetical protein
MVFPDTGVTTRFKITINTAITTYTTQSIMDSNLTYDVGAVTGEILSPNPQTLFIEMLGPPYSNAEQGNFYLRFQGSQQFIDSVNNQLQVDNNINYRNSYYNRYTNAANIVFTIVFQNFITTPPLTIDGTAGNNILGTANCSVTFTPLTQVPASNICFIGSTPILTDQGLMPIESMNNTHTINGVRIRAITKTVSTDEHLVNINKDSIAKGVPNRTTTMSLLHKLLYNDEMTCAKYVKEGELIPYQGELLYNILLEWPSLIIVNNLAVETLDPNNSISRQIKESL